MSDIIEVVLDIGSSTVVEVVERGPQGIQGPSGTLSIGTVSTTAYPGPPTVVNSGTAENAVLDFTLVTGDKGDAATIAVGAVSTTSFPAMPSVTNVGTANAAVLDFVLTTGEKGDAATVAVGTVNTVSPSTPASVTNVGTSKDAIFNFNIPKGDTGEVSEAELQALLAALVAPLRPVVLTQPLAVSGNVGDSLSISCLGGILPNTHLNLTYQWQLSTDAGVSYNNITGATSPSIPFTPALFGNNGLYRCRLGNAFGTQNTNAVALTVDNAIRHLYGVNDRGIAWDLDRMDHLFQNPNVSTGASPVTAYGDPVGLILTRERGGLDNIGPRLEINGNFTNDLTGWTQAGGSTATWANGVMRIDSGTIFGGRWQDVTVAGSRMVEVVVTARRTAGSATLQLAVYPRTGGFAEPSFSGGAITSSDWVTRRCFVQVEPSATGVRLYFQSQTSSTGSQWEIDSVSVREVPGVHLIQATSSRRPTYARRPKSGIRQLLTNSIFAGAASGSPGTFPTSLNTGNIVGTVTTSYASEAVTCTVATGGRIAFRPTNISVVSGQTLTLSVDIEITSGSIIASQILLVGSGVAGTVTYRLNGNVVMSNSVIPAGQHRLSATIVFSASGSTINQFGVGASSPIASPVVAILSRPQLELGPESAYQRVTNQFDVTETGQPSINYLWFDGIDDCLQSATAIDFSNSDEMTVCVGARRNAAGLAYLVEHGNGGGNGLFSLFVPVASGIPDANSFRSVGTTSQGIATPQNYPANVVQIISTESKISTDLIRMRQQGASVAETTSLDQGTGNYRSDVLNIGSRNQANSFFNGHLNSGFIINRILNPLVLADYERHWVAAKAGIDL